MIGGRPTSVARPAYRRKRWYSCCYSGQSIYISHTCQTLMFNLKIVQPVSPACKAAAAASSLHHLLYASCKIDDGNEDLYKSSQVYHLQNRCVLPFTRRETVNLLKVTVYNTNDADKVVVWSCAGAKGKAVHHNLLWQGSGYFSGWRGRLPKSRRRRRMAPLYQKIRKLSKTTSSLN